MTDSSRHRIIKCAGGIVEIDLDDALVVKNGLPVSLTRNEWNLAEVLALKEGDAIPYSELLASTWGPEFQQDYPYLRVWISRLREKLEPVPAEPRIVVSTSDGYRLNVDRASS